MKSTSKWLIAAGLVALLVATIRVGATRAAGADARKSFTITRLYAGPDGQSLSEEMEVKFTPGDPSDVAKILGTGAPEFHRRGPGKDNGFRNPPRRQYVITLSGRGEVELSDGKKITLDPGHIELAEDMTGKGHATRVLGNEDWVTLQLPLSDQSAH